MNRSAIRRAGILAAAALLALETTTAIAQTPPACQSPQAVTPQVVWTPTYYYDAAGALWLVYVPTTQAAAPTQAVAPTQTPAVAPTQTSVAAPASALQPGVQAPRSMISPRNPELGTGRNIRMHKPWMSGRR